MRLELNELVSLTERHPDVNTVELIGGRENYLASKFDFNDDFSFWFYFSISARRDHYFVTSVLVTVSGLYGPDFPDLKKSAALGTDKIRGQKSKNILLRSIYRSNVSDGYKFCEEEMRAWFIQKVIEADDIAKKQLARISSLHDFGVVGHQLRYFSPIYAPIYELYIDYRSGGSAWEKPLPNEAQIVVEFRDAIKRRVYG